MKKSNEQVIKRKKKPQRNEDEKICFYFRFQYKSHIFWRSEERALAQAIYGKYSLK